MALVRPKTKVKPGGDAGRAGVPADRGACLARRFYARPMTSLSGSTSSLSSRSSSSVGGSVRPS